MGLPIFLILSVKSVKLILLGEVLNEVKSLHKSDGDKTMEQNLSEINLKLAKLVRLSHEVYSLVGVMSDGEALKLEQASKLIDRVNETFLEIIATCDN